MRKIIAIIASVAIIISILNISAYADTSTGGSEHGGGSSDGSRDRMTSQEYNAAQSYLIDKFCNGEITYSQFQEQSQAVTDEFLSSIDDPVGSVAATAAHNTANTFSAISQKIGSIVEKWGDDARQYVSEWWNGLTQNVPTETVKTPTTDYMGYGAIYTDFVEDNYYWFNGFDYIVVEDLGNGLVRVTGYGNVYLQVQVQNGNVILREEKELTKPSSRTLTYVNGSFYNNGQLVKLSGDVRYSDGTPFPTGEEFEISNKKKFDDLSAPDLEEILNDFAEALEEASPDLSTIEGLLKAIYARMGKLDSDNDNELLSAINSNILKLINADKDNDDKEDNTNEELVKTLLEIRDALKEGTLGTSPEAHGHEISGTVYNVIPLDKNFFNKLFHSDVNLKVEYEGKTYYLEDCGCLKIGDKFYNIDVDYSSSLNIDFDFNNSDFDDFNVNFSGGYNSSNVSFGNLENLLPQNSKQRSISLYSSEHEKPFFYKVLTNSQSRKLDKVSDIVKEFVAVGVPYDSIQENLYIYETIIFNNNYTPQDLTFTIFGQECTLLSYDNIISSDGIWEGSDYTESINIVKALTSILISFWWVLSMYKKLSNLV